MCTPEACPSRGFFVPDDGATVPANLPAIYWRPRGDVAQPSPANVTLTTLADPGTPLAFTATRVGDTRDHLIVPDAPLVAGTEYVLTDGGACSPGPYDGGPRATFTVGPAAPLPTSLGALVITGTQDGTWSISGLNGTCYVLTDIAGVRVGVDFTRAPDAAPWRDVLHFSTFVDGAAWTPNAATFSAYEPGASWEGRGVDLLHSACNEDGTASTLPNIAYDLRAGTHVVEMRATLPLTDVELATAPIEVTVGCPADLDDDAAAGGCCATSSHPGGALVLALALSALLTRRRRAR